ncbi:hypothetical protein FIV31_06140 [Coxiella endosymbiont of Ornithodoros amblus]|uniref:hypothetical protein n=1 Tax=Coxiella endosymbiont of Ornithodoros amblus TaxID=1656166 RepID=UPI00244D9F68|nr:hypothetical protein [Coxiella endosymbiont of Ornithodoros amblus]MBW5802921.1 hypothetical protein [Coxiella endosymbiont of Ornithodoros amblus]
MTNRSKRYGCLRFPLWIADLNRLPHRQLLNIIITQLNREVISHAIDIHGGNGICMGPNNYLVQGFI